MVSAPRRPRVVVGTDTRPTGAKIAQAAIASLLESRIEVEYLYIAASPEIMAYASQNEDLDGFFYVSASHNPVGHNGIKMGGHDGGVLPRSVAVSLIRKLQEAVRDASRIKWAANTLSGPLSKEAQTVLSSFSPRKKAALATYASFSAHVIKGEGTRADECFAAFAASTKAASPGIDMGSAWLPVI